MERLYKDELREKKIKSPTLKPTTTLSNVPKTTLPKTTLPKKCQLCNLTFDNKAEYYNHKPSCVLKFDIMQNPNQHMNHILAIKEENIPNTIDYLLKSFITMKQRIEELEHIVHKQRKKISILEWLNNNITPSVTFQEWYFHLDSSFSLELANLVFENGFTNGVISILKHLLPIDNENVVPMRSYHEQKNIIYVYVENKDTSGRYWTKMTDIQFELVINCISKLLITQLFVWKKNRERELNSPIEDIDDQYKIYATYKSRVLGNNKDKTELLPTIKRHLYEYLKMRLSGAVEYEFTWN